MIENAYICDRVGDIIKEWDCLRMYRYMPRAYDDVIDELCEDLSPHQTVAQIMKIINREFRRNYKNEYKRVSADTVIVAAEKIKTVFDEVMVKPNVCAAL